MALPRKTIVTIRADLRRTGRRLFRPIDVIEAFRSHRREWGLPKNVTQANVIGFLTSEAELRDVSLTSNSKYPSIPRYAWAAVSHYEVALSAKPDAYCSHETALFLNGLMDQEPDTIYVNQEQRPKSPRQASRLTQEGISRAFSNQQRLSKYVLQHDGFKIILLSGKNTERLGVRRLAGPHGEQLWVTDVERTLLDVVVRPVYGGGVRQILRAFELARPRASVDRLLKILKRVDHMYPYHQALGFYLERAGFDQQELAKVSKLGIVFDFFLAHRLRKRRYSRRWRLYYPAEL